MANLTEKQKELLEKYIVLEGENSYYDEYYITLRSNFEYLPVCNTYDNYGQEMDTCDCGCENEDGEETGEHSEVYAWNYCDGSNWRTIELGEYSEWSEVDEDESLSILTEKPESTPYIKGATHDEETENYVFNYSRWQDNPWICTVRK